MENTHKIKLPYGAMKKVASHLGIGYQAARIRILKNDPEALSVIAIMEEERIKSTQSALDRIKKAQSHKFDCLSLTY